MPVTFRKKTLNSLILAAAITPLTLLPAVGFADSEKTIYIMHTGDLHGDTDAHPNERDDATGLLEGGLARAATVIKSLKKKHKGKIVWGHTGDSIQGSALATYTQGKALVDIWDALSPDLFATGNWEYVYGLYRYQQLFGTNEDIKAISPDEYSQMFMVPEDPSGQVYKGLNPKRAFKRSSDGEKRRWRTIAANAYYNGQDPGPGINAKGAGEHFTDPFHVEVVNGIRIGFIGCTTNRGPQVVSSNVTKGVSFSNCAGGVKFPQNKPIQWPEGHPNRDAAAEKLDDLGGMNPARGSTVGFRTVNEVVKYTSILRAPQGKKTEYINSLTGKPWKGQGVDLVVLMSEAGLPESLWNAETQVMPEGVRFPEIILSSDTHERTRLPVVATNVDGNKTVIIEEGEDGMQVGLLELEFENGKLKEWEWSRYDIDESVPEDSEIADLIKDAQSPFTSVAGGGEWQEGDSFINPFNGYKLTVPFDHVVGYTDIVLERNRFSYEHEPEKLKMPADIEGTLHDLYADTFRAMSGSDVGEIRGFRYNNTIPVGAITIKDLYHSLTIGAMIAQGRIPSSPEAEHAAAIDEPGKCVFDKTSSDYRNNKVNKCHFLGWPRSLVQTFELSGNGTQQPNIPGWSGGWFFNYSGVNFDLDVYQPNFDKYGSKLRSRVSNVRLVDPITGEDRHAAGELPANVTIGAYYYDADFNRINRNQVVTAGSCQKAGFPGLTRACADTKMMIVAKTGEHYGAPLAWVSSSQFAAGKAAGFNIYPLDVVEAVGRYISDGKDSNGDISILDLRSGEVIETSVKGLKGKVDANEFAKTFPRINLLDELPDGRTEFGFGIIQPMRGATKNPTRVVDTPDDEGDF